MKKLFTIYICFVLILSVFGFKASQFILMKQGKPQQNKSNTKHITSLNGMNEDSQGRLNWELKRLADPATGKIPDNIRQKELAFAATLPNDAEGRSLGERAALNIVSRGPWNVGGRTRAFGIDVSDENRLLAGTPSGGMWLSTNGGASWTMSNTESQLKNVTCLVQDKRPNHTNVWYYGGGEAYGASASTFYANYLGDGLFKSIDNGVTWQPIASTAGGAAQTFSIGWQLVWNLANDVSANDSVSVIYAAVYGGIMRSTDGGTSWTMVQSGSSSFTDVAVTTTGTVYTTLSSSGGTQDGIWRSANGTSFTKITPLNFPAAYCRITMGINPSNENELYFLANNGPGSGKLTYNYMGNPEWNSLWKYTYLSGNGSGAGGSWQNLSANLPNAGSPYDKWLVQGSYDMVVRVKPGGGNIVFIGGTDLYRSTTGFQDSLHTAVIGGYGTFTPPIINDYPNHHPDQHCLEFLPSNPNTMFSTNDGGIFKTTDNTAGTVAWQSLNNGYLASMFYTVAIDHAVPGNDIIIGGTQDNGNLFTNNTTSTSPWTASSGGDGSYCAIADNHAYYYFSIQNGMMGKATCDANGNITALARIDPIGLTNPLFINPFVLDPNNNNLMYLAGGQYLWKNTDLSGIPLIFNWDSISTNWVKFPYPVSGGGISAVTACKTPLNRVYYGTLNNTLYRVDNANIGTPAPVDISSTTSGALFPSGGYVSCIAADPDDGNKAFAVFSNYSIFSIFYTADGGTTWSKQGGNLDASGNGPSVRWISILPVADGKVYLAATSTGLYATDSLKGSATVWVQQGTNTIGNAVCDMIETRVSDGLVVIATHANGIFSTNITSVNDITTIADITSSKTDLRLINYPNPVIQSTTIEFILNKKSIVNLQVCDECGRLIETIVNETMQEGKHSILFDKKNLRAGIYYYCLTTGSQRKTNKMVIIK